MKVLVVQGPNAGRVLDMSTRQAEDALARGWAALPAAEVTPAAPPAEVEPVAPPVAALPAPRPAAPARLDWMGRKK